jgi:hypothetical protein
LTLITEGGKDSVLLERTLAYKNFYADLGNGDDQMNAWGLNARGSVTIDGGYGIDFFYGSANYLNPSKRGRFELHYN